VKPAEGGSEPAPLSWMPQAYYGVGTEGDVHGANDKAAIPS